MFERYTESARRALFFARYEASELGASAIETEHILLGVLRASRGIAAEVLKTHVSLEDARKQIETRVTRGEQLPTSVEIPFSADTKKVLHDAAAEADSLGHNYISTEHLILGLLRVQYSVAASILIAHGLNLNTARERVVNLLATSGVSVHAPADALQVIHQLVEELGQAAPDTEQPRHLLDHIRQALDDLRRYLK
jgi:ATP-dependent Clp protease ATP-binding subunit ClpC